MEVILREDFPALGYIGDRVSVKRGYARNFLIPRGVAVECGSGSARVIAHQMSGINARKARLKVQAEEAGKALSAAKLEFVLKLGGQGRSFGAVTVKDIDSALQQQGFQIDRRQLKLAEAIKCAGDFEVSVKLHSEVVVTLPVKVTAEIVQSAEADADEASEKPRKGRRSRKSDDAPAEDNAPSAEDAMASEGGAN